MNNTEKEKLKLEIEHIFNSGANEIRVFEMVERFIDRKESDVISNIHYDISLKAMELMKDKGNMTTKEFRELPEVKKLWNAMDVIKEYYL